MPRNRNANRINEAALHRLKGIFISPVIKELSGRLSHRFPRNTKPETITIHGGRRVFRKTRFSQKLISRESDRTGVGRGVDICGKGWWK
ncbi:hypothetical protein CEXT_732741 [Caerostris extrusa]|uniref:Uncharacterized protein n=1 Tax=Caerostris extrusa TaxID=172846 RepID=A0AAV4R1B7_CAEEX|nr:hypothetical protein CEXT_732741 [Caerostris extrusa]